MDFSKPSAPPAYGGNLPPATGIPVQPPPNNNYHQFTDNFQQPPQHISAADFPGRWSSGLCDCFSDVPNCCITLWCPCITFGQVAEIVDRGSTSCGVSGVVYGAITLITGCGCLYSCFYRTKLRNQYMLPKGPCGDCMVHCCCEACALCQEYRELKHRGFHMALGWQGNVEKRNGARMAPPVVEGGMGR